MEEKTICPKSRAEWRAWLEKNHLRESKVAVIKYKKHTGKHVMTHKESMGDAICFGWIDTTIKKLDEDRYIRRFSKRSPRGRWSENTLSYARDMIKQGKMFPAGMKAYEEGLTRPTLDSDVAKNPGVPQDLIKELKARKADKIFEAWTPSYKRMYLRWIERAKAPETRANRVREVVERVLSGKKKWN